MPHLPKEKTSWLWENLNWIKAHISRSKAKNKPLMADAPKKAGLYRIIWMDTDRWHNIDKEYTAKSTRKIIDPQVKYDALHPPICLSIGRTTNIYERIRQHFGTNKNNNRLFQRLRQIMPNNTWNDEGVREEAMRSIQIEYVEVSDWIERCLLESYGKAIQKPILDLDPEH